VPSRAPAFAGVKIGGCSSCPPSFRGARCWRAGTFQAAAAPRSLLALRSRGGEHGDRGSPAGDWISRAERSVEEGSTVVELKGLLKERGLPVSGTKAVLISKLKEAIDEAQSELLSSGGADAGGLAVGQQLIGTVTNITAYGAFVDVGSDRGDGLVPSTKMSTGKIDDINKVLSVGQEVKVWVSNIRDDSAIELSMIKRLAEPSSNRVPMSDFQVGQKVTGAVTNVETYGVFVDIGAARDGLLPSSKFAGDVPSLWQEVGLWVSKVQDSKLELSMTAPTDEADLVEDLPRKSIEDLVPGQKLAGVVKNVQNYGAFINVGAERDGLLPKNRMEGSLDPGDHIEVFVRAIRDDGRFELTLSSDDVVGESVDEAAPAGDEESRLPVQGLEVGAKITGTVKKVVAFGVFVDVGATRDGLVPISKVLDEFVEDGQIQLEGGEEVDVWVSQVRPDGALELTMDESKVPSGERDTYGQGGGASRPPAFAAGDKVRARWQGTGEWDRADVVEDRGDGTFAVRWEDHDQDTVHPPEELRKIVHPYGTPLDSLEEGQSLQGTVVHLLKVGALVDVGAEFNGIVHMKRMTDGFVSDVNEVVSVGQEVSVWVHAKHDAVSLELTMVEGGGSARTEKRPPSYSRDLSPFVDVPDDDWFDGVIVKVMDYGAIVEIEPPEGGDPRRGMVHISQLTEGFVDDINEVVHEGQELRVRVLSVDEEAQRMSLTAQENSDD